MEKYGLNILFIKVRRLRSEGLSGKTQISSKQCNFCDKLIVSLLTFGFVIFILTLE